MDGGILQARPKRFVLNKRKERRREGFGAGELAFAQDMAEPARFEIARVFELVAAGGALEGHQKSGLFEGERFEYRVAARPREDEVRRRIGACHIGLIRKRRISAGRAVQRASLPAKVQNLKLSEQGGKMRPHCLVEGVAAASAAEHEEHGLLS